MPPRLTLPGLCGTLEPVQNHQLHSHPLGPEEQLHDHPPGRGAGDGSDPGTDPNEGRGTKPPVPKPPVRTSAVPSEREDRVSETGRVGGWVIMRVDVDVGGDLGVETWRPGMRGCPKRGEDKKAKACESMSLRATFREHLTSPRLWKTSPE